MNNTLLPGGQMLQLPRARVEDAGQYVCTATNSAGQDQKSILLSVYGEMERRLVTLLPSARHTQHPLWSNDPITQRNTPPLVW